LFAAFLALFAFFPAVAHGHSCFKSKAR
jgi:hypothetical protein